MCTLFQQEQKKVRQLCEKSLQEFGEDDLNRFAMEVFPIVQTGNIFDIIPNKIFTFYVLKSIKNFSFEDIAKIVIEEMAGKIGPKFVEKVRQLLEGQFIDLIKKRVNLETGKTRGDNYIITHSAEPKKAIPDVAQSKKTIPDVKPKQQPKPVKTAPKADQRTLSLEHTASKQSRAESQSKRPANKDTDLVINLHQIDLCICGKIIDQNSEGLFTCCFCFHQYHIECMKKGSNPTTCQFCSIKYLIPNKVVKQTLFLGTLKKGKKRHQIYVNFDKEEAFKTPYKLQMRSIRLKQQTQNIILFPDSATITFNDHFSKEFTPLHKQSSLKYRRDQPLLIGSLHIKSKQNKLVIVQRSNIGKPSREERIEPQNHLFGLFLIQEKKIDTLVSQIRIDGLTTVQESQKLLMTNFGIAHDELSLQTLQIPLTCCITTERIKYPVRGFECLHFQCFDLKNFLTIICSASCPRWQCPLCKKPVYAFKFDCIILAILEDFKKTAATQVMFYKTGAEFTLLKNDTTLNDNVIYNLKDLRIEPKGKRPPSPSLTEDEVEKKKKQKGVIPEDADVIDLD